MVRFGARAWPVLLAASVVAAVALSVSNAQGSASMRSSALKARTLVSTRGEILAFSQDGEHIAWVRDDCYVVARNLRTGRRARVDSSACLDVQISLALGGRRVLFGTESCGSEVSCNHSVYSGALGDRKLRPFGYYGFSWDDHPHPSLGVEADGDTLAFLLGFRVTRVRGRTQVPLPETPSPTGVAVALGRIMISTREPAIEIRRAEDGEVASRFMPIGDPSEIALSKRFAAVLSRQDGGTQIELFQPTTGEPLGAVSVPRAAQSLSIAGKTVVFRTGRKIRSLDGASRRQVVLAIAAADPIGLSIEGRRVAWAEYLGDNARRSRIRAITLRGR